MATSEVGTVGITYAVNPYGMRVNGVLREMNAGLHEISQPVTALLCLLQYGESIVEGDEMKFVVSSAREASERLCQTVRTMQTTLSRELQENPQ